MEGEEHRLPERLGPYRIIRHLGRGGMGNVFEAENLRLGKRVALKSLHEHLAHKNISIARFLREGRAASQIAHPHVVTVFELGEENGVPYLVMELLDGIDLAEHLDRQGPLAPAAIAELMLPLASALAAAHAAGIVHRDLKPSNVIIARDHFGALLPKIVDFGISKMQDEGGDALTRTQSMLGTVNYMSPEQSRSARNAGAASDQYSLGVILYECATGSLPFAGESMYEVLHAIMTQPVRPPSELRPELPAAFDALVLRALAKRPEDRFPSIAALGAALLDFATPELRERWAPELEPARVATQLPRRMDSANLRAITEDSTLPAAPETGPPAYPRSRAALAVAIVLTALLSGAAWIFTRGEEPAPVRMPEPSVAIAPPTVTPTVTAAKAAPQPAATPPPATPPKKSTRTKSTKAAAPSVEKKPAVQPEIGDNGAVILE